MCSPFRHDVLAMTMLRFLTLQVDFAALCKLLAWSACVEVADGAALWAYHSKQKHAWGTPEWAKQTALAQDDISSAIANQTDSDTHLACTQAFVQAFGKDTPMRLSRFQTLQNHILETLLPKLVKQGLADADVTIQRFRRTYLACQHPPQHHHTFHSQLPHASVQQHSWRKAPVQSWRKAPVLTKLSPRNHTIMTCSKALTE